MKVLQLTLTTSVSLNLLKNIFFRFLILRRRPTMRKGLCVAVILVAEFICLLPTIFPWLESGKQHKEDGGSSGAAAILWPLCFIISQVIRLVKKSNTDLHAHKDSVTFRPIILQKLIKKKM